MGKKGTAFTKGGCGCLIAFVVVGLLVVLAGGNVHIDAGGTILLFVIGGTIGLVVLAIYNRGKRDADD
jgi:hypothetical protein